MQDPIIVFNIDAPTEIDGAAGGSGGLLWKRLVPGFDLVGDLESLEYARLGPHGKIGEHVHTGTEEIYFITKGRARMIVDDEAAEVGPGDLVLTPIGGKHSATPLDGGFEFLVAEVTSAGAPMPGRPRNARKIGANGTAIVNLAEMGSLDPAPYFSGSWKSISYETIRAGAPHTLDAADCERALYVVTGTGQAVSRSRQLSLEPGHGFALPLGGHAVVEADEQMEAVVVTLAVAPLP